MWRKFVKLKSVFQSSSFSRLGYWYPFGISGTFLLAVATYLLGFSISYYNLYAFFISLLIFLLLIFLVGAGFFLRLRHFPASNQADISHAKKIQPVDSHCHSRLGYRLRVSTEKELLPFFFRLHVVSQLVQIVGRKTQISMHREFCVSGGKQLDFLFPLSGPVSGSFRAFFKDALGLTRFALWQCRTDWIVNPSISFDKKFSSQSRAQQEQNENVRKESDHYEKIHLREYAPGDRAKDIQWKVSQRLDMLTTRIAVHAKKEIPKIQILFDHVHSQSHTDNARSLFHLEVLKSALLDYIAECIHSQKKMEVFFSNGQEMKVHTQEGLYELATLLARTQYITPEQAKLTRPMPLSSSSFRFFATPYHDIDLNNYQGQKIFLTGEAKQPPLHHRRGATNPSTATAIEIALVDVEKNLYWPGWWIFRKLGDIPALLGLSYLGFKQRFAPQATRGRDTSCNLKKPITMIYLKPRFIH